MLRFLYTLKYNMTATRNLHLYYSVTHISNEPLKLAEQFGVGVMLYACTPSSNLGQIPIIFPVEFWDTIFKDPTTVSFHILTYSPLTIVSSHSMLCNCWWWGNVLILPNNESAGAELSITLCHSVHQHWFPPYIDLQRVFHNLQKTGRTRDFSRPRSRWARNYLYSAILTHHSTDPSGVTYLEREDTINTKVHNINSDYWQSTS